jgi:hypothetical protein
LVALLYYPTLFASPAARGVEWVPDGELSDAFLAS